MAHPGGRPTLYTPELGDRICDEITQGKSLLSICKQNDMPVTVTVYRWLREYPEFSNNYARARENQADFYADQIISEADKASDRDSAAAAKVKVDARKWVASKLKPRKYGAQVDVTTNGKDLPTPILRIPDTTHDIEPTNTDA